jgi:Mitochondrial genome maintenance MGM101
MNEEITTTSEAQQLTKVDATPPQEAAVNQQPPPDAKALRTGHIGKLLGMAYEGASTLKLTSKEAKDLRADFPDESIEIRPHDGIIYISHMALRERLWDVFGPTNVAEICRERFIRSDTNEVAVDLVLMIRGVFIAEGVGTAKYYPNNAAASFGDTVEAAWSDAIRRCCKKFGVGTQVWRPQYVRDWLTKYAGKGGNGKWFKRKAAAAEEKPATDSKPRQSREYTLREPESRAEEIRDKGQHGGAGEGEPMPAKLDRPTFHESDEDHLPF